MSECGEGEGFAGAGVSWMRVLGRGWRKSKREMERKKKRKRERDNNLHIYTHEKLTEILLIHLKREIADAEEVAGFRLYFLRGLLHG